MARKPVFDFGLDRIPRARERQEWLDVAQDTQALGAASLEDARLLALDRVEPGPWQVRRTFHAEKMAELVESIRSQGVLEPILVRATGQGRYQIVAGERRYRAALEAGFTTIPARVLDIDEVGARVVALMENIQRDDLNEVERAEGLVALKELTGQTWEDVARLLGITKRHVLHLVSLTRLPEPVQARIRVGQLSAKHGRLLAYVKDPEVQVELADLVADLRLNAHQTAELVKRLGSEPGFTSQRGHADSGASTPNIRERLTTLALSVIQPGTPPAVPAPDVPAITAGDIQQLLAAVNEVRRAIVAFPGGPLESEAARRLHLELSALVQASEALLGRLPHPSDV